jgi:hypothetical protein
MAGLIGLLRDQDRPPVQRNFSYRGLVEKLRAGFAHGKGTFTAK